MRDDVRLGLRANAAQFSLLVGVNVLVGALVGLERSMLPIVGEQGFGLASRTIILTFVVAFGAAKAIANLAAGVLADHAGRKRLLVLGWLVALPVPALVGMAPGWWLVALANVLLGISQGLAWSMTVVMKIDLVGARRRGFALGLNEAAGYLGVAATAFLTGMLATTFAPRSVIWIGALAIATVGLVISIVWVRDTGEHVAREQGRLASTRPMTFRSAFSAGTVHDPVLRACSQAGFVNNLNDALAWGLVPLYLAAHGASAAEIGTVAALYPAVWGALQPATGWLSDRRGRQPLIVLGMALQAVALALLVVGAGRFDRALAAAALLGLGTAFVYPTLIAAVSDVAEPRDRASLVGVYRFWRDTGLVAGALLAGALADAFGGGVAIVVVTLLTALSGLVVAVTPWRKRLGVRPAVPMAAMLDFACGEGSASTTVEPSEVHAPRRER